MSIFRAASPSFPHYDSLGQPPCNVCIIYWKPLILRHFSIFLLFSSSPISYSKCTYHYSQTSTRNEKIHVFRLIHFMSKCSHPPHIQRENPLHSIWKCTYHYPQTCTLKPHFSAITDDYNGHHRLRKIDWKFRVDIQWEQAARKDRFIKVSKAHKAQYVVSYKSF